MEIEENVAKHLLLEEQAQTIEGEEKAWEEVKADWEQKKVSMLEQKTEQEAKITDAETDSLPVKYPPAVKEHERLNIILIGPEKSGKTTVCNYLA